MHIGLLHLHNLARWIVLLAGAAAIVTAAVGLLRGGSWGRGPRLAGLAFLIVLDVQVLIGLLLYVVSPLVRSALANAAAAMSDHRLRFFLLEHLALMLGAAVLVHVGYALAKRARAPRVALSRSLLFFALAFAVILIATPWWRPLLPGS
jgi:hypothetical protein